MRSKLLTLLLCICIILCVLSASIGLPIYIRPFYYMQIETLGIPERTGMDKAAIIDAYDEVLDFLTLPGREFGAGAFSYSESGKAHFEDCKILFDLNAAVLLCSAGGILILLCLKKRKYFRLSRPFGKHCLFTCGASTLSVFAVLAVLAAADFERAFTVFHTLFFPGKDNWIFDWRTDPIILALPETFFMHCAILIVSSIFLCSLAFILYGSCRKADP